MSSRIVWCCVKRMVLYCSALYRLVCYDIAFYFGCCVVFNYLELCCFGIVLSSTVLYCFVVHCFVLSWIVLTCIRGVSWLGLDCVVWGFDWFGLYCLVLYCSV